jgi:hypothetical protein
MMMRVEERGKSRWRRYGGIGGQQMVSGMGRQGGREVEGREGWSKRVARQRYYFSFVYMIIFASLCFVGEI